LATRSVAKNWLQAVARENPLPGYSPAMYPPARITSLASQRLLASTCMTDAQLRPLAINATRCALGPQGDCLRPRPFMRNMTAPGRKQHLNTVPSSWSCSSLKWAKRSTRTWKANSMSTAFAPCTSGSVNCGRSVFRMAAFEAINAHLCPNHARSVPSPPYS